MMKMKIGTKILLSALVPAVFLSAVLTFIVVRNVNKMGQADVRMVSSNMTDMKKAELKNYIDIAVNSVSFLVNSAEFTPEEAKEEAKKNTPQTDIRRGRLLFCLRQAGAVPCAAIKPEA
ncbi:MAG: hypothetical protein LRY50_11055 [Geovibrio sp.]|nr:hypothetical protein [Geovibrio sp.]